MPFYAIKTTSLKSRKIDIFPKGSTHYFGQKIAIFPTFFLGNIGQEKVFYNIQERKNAFLDYKNKTFKKSKNWHFSKRVNPGFGSKKWHYSAFLFWQYRPGKCLLRHFSKGVNPWFWSKNGHLSNFFFLAIYARKISFTIFENEKTPF